MEIFGVDKNGDKAETHLQQVPKVFPRKKKETSPKSSASNSEKRVIMPISVPKKKTRVKKLVAIPAISMLITITRGEAVENGENSRSNLVWVLYI